MPGSVGFEMAKERRKMRLVSLLESQTVFRSKCNSNIILPIIVQLILKLSPFLCFKLLFEIISENSL